MIEKVKKICNKICNMTYAIEDLNREEIERVFYEK